MNLRVFYLTRRGISDGYSGENGGENVAGASNVCYVVVALTLRAK